MKLQGISEKGLRRIASKVGQEKGIWENTNPDYGDNTPFEGTIDEFVAEMQEMFEVWADEAIYKHDDLYGPAPSKEELIEQMKEEFIKGLEKIGTTSKRAQAGDSRVIDGVQFQWDTESNPDDPGWVYLDAQGYPQAVPGLEGRDPQATDEELALAAFGTTASRRLSRKQYF